MELEIPIRAAKFLKPPLLLVVVGNGGGEEGEMGDEGLEALLLCISDVLEIVEDLRKWAVG